MSTNHLATQDSYVNKVTWEIGMCRYDGAESIFLGHVYSLASTLFGDVWAWIWVHFVTKWASQVNTSDLGCVGVHMDPFVTVQIARQTEWWFGVSVIKCQSILLSNRWLTKWNELSCESVILWIRFVIIRTALPSIRIMYLSLCIFSV